VGASVCGPASLIGLHAEGKLFAITDSGETFVRDAEIKQKSLHSLRTLGAESEIVLVCPAIITMPLDFDVRGTIRLEPGRVSFEHLPRCRGKVKAVKLEMDILERAGLVRLQLLLEPF
jgi:hypothetical protein